MIGSGPQKPLIVTAADHRFARTLAQFLLSAERHREHHRCRVMVYDLGLSDADRALLRRRFSWAELRTISFSDYPPHVSLSAASYAWKPVIIREAGAETAGPLFWFDSATIIRQPLDEPLVAVEKHGVWVLRSQTPLAQKCDPRVLDALEVPLEVRHLREYAAGAVGFDMGSPLGFELVESWAQHALIAEHIVPDGYPHYHKHDQALLNCLLAKAMHRGALTMPVEEVDISSASPTKSISTRNVVGNAWPLFVDPLLRMGSALWKAGDVAYHRLRSFDDTVLDGRKRRRQDHFSVKLWQLPFGTETLIPGPSDGYYADPFVIHRDDGLWLFLEEFTYPRDRGFLTVVGLDERLSVTSAEPVLFLPDYAALDSHASFPCIFELDGEPHMIPETHERRSIDIYVCESWPARWRLRRRLRLGVDAADSMVIREGGLWYLLTSVEDGGSNRHLEIHYTDDLFTGQLQPHPINNEKRYGDQANGTGRNAGFLGRQADGTLARLIQYSPNYYGEGIRAMRITTLTPAEFQEEPIESIDSLPGITAGFPTHHATRSGDVLAFDIRDRVG